MFKEPSPSPDEVREQLRLMLQSDSFKQNNGRASFSARFLRTIVDRYLNSDALGSDSWKASDILQGLYAADGAPSNTDRAKGKRLQELRDSVDLYFYRLPEQAIDRVVFKISRSDGCCEPTFERRGQKAENEGVFTHLGDNQSAMERYIALARIASKIEDTAVRWDNTITNLKYPREQMDRLEAALKGNPVLKFRSITGQIIDENFAHALLNVERHFPGRIRGARLQHTFPLMNFTIFEFPKELNLKETVFFGYGKNTGADFSNDMTAVFSTEDARIVKEFRRLFGLLKNGYCYQVSVSGDGFALTRPEQTELVTAFEKWPDEIARRITESSEHVRICIAGWSHFSTYKSSIERALDRNVPVTVALWEPDGEFVKARSTAFPGQDSTIRQTMEGLIEVKSKRPALEVLMCKGWGSVSLFWLDEDMYFGNYWVKQGTLLGPYFLCRERTKTGDQLKKEYYAMIEGAAQV